MVTIGTQPNCQPCRLTKMRLTSKGISFVEVPVTDLTDIIEAHGYVSAPVVVVGDDSWSGYRPDRIDALA